MLLLAITLTVILSGTAVWIWNRIKIVNNDLEIIEANCSALRYTIQFIRSVQEDETMTLNEKFRATFNI